MYILASFDCKFKTNSKNIEKILQHFGLRKIQSSLYAGDLENSEHEMLMKNINEIIKEQNSVLIVQFVKIAIQKKNVAEGK